MLDPDHSLADLERGLEMRAGAGENPASGQRAEDRAMEMPTDDSSHPREARQQLGERDPV